MFFIFGVSHRAGTQFGLMCFLPQDQQGPLQGPPHWNWTLVTPCTWVRHWTWWNQQWSRRMKQCRGWRTEEETQNQKYILHQLELRLSEWLFLKGTSICQFLFNQRRNNSLKPKIRIYKYIKNHRILVSNRKAPKNSEPPAPQCSLSVQAE